MEESGNATEGIEYRELISELLPSPEAELEGPGEEVVLAESSGVDTEETEKTPGFYPCSTCAYCGQGSLGNVIWRGQCTGAWDKEGQGGDMRANRQMTSAIPVATRPGSPV